MAAFVFACGFDCGGAEVSSRVDSIMDSGFDWGIGVGADLSVWVLISRFGVFRRVP